MASSSTTPAPAVFPPFECQWIDDGARRIHVVRIEPRGRVGYEGHTVDAEGVAAPRAGARDQHLVPSFIASAHRAVAARAVRSLAVGKRLLASVKRDGGACCS